MANPILRAVILAALTAEDPEAVCNEVIAGEAVADAVVETMMASAPSKFLEIARRKSSRRAHVALRLLSWYDESWMSWPAEYAVAVTAAAADICRADDVPLVLRCRAEKEYGNALADAGRYEEAGRALARSEKTALCTALPQLHLAPIKLARAKLKMQMHRFAEALPQIEAAKALYAESPQAWRVESCRPMEARAQYHAGRYAEARATFDQIFEQARANDDEQTAVANLVNVGLCDVLLGDNEQARRALRGGISVCQRLGLALVKVRAMAGISLLDIRQRGDTSMLRDTLSQYDDLGRVDEWILLQLHAASEFSDRDDRNALIASCREARTRAYLHGLRAADANALELLVIAAESEGASRQMIEDIAGSIDLSPAALHHQASEAVN